MDIAAPGENLLILFVIRLIDLFHDHTLVIYPVNNFCLGHVTLPPDSLIQLIIISRPSGVARLLY